MLCTPNSFNTFVIQHYNLDKYNYVIRQKNDKNIKRYKKNILILYRVPVFQILIIVFIL